MNYWLIRIVFFMLAGYLFICCLANIGCAPQKSPPVEAPVPQHCITIEDFTEQSFQAHKRQYIMDRKLWKGVK